MAWNTRINRGSVPDEGKTRKTWPLGTAHNPGIDPLAEKDIIWNWFG